MKTLTYTPEQLEKDGWENTYMTVGNSEVWQNHDERILYDPESGYIMSRYYRERKDCCNHSIRTGSLRVGERVRQ